MLTRATPRITTLPVGSSTITARSSPMRLPSGPNDSHDSFSDGPTRCVPRLKGNKRLASVTSASALAGGRIAKSTSPAAPVRCAARSASVSARRLTPTRPPTRSSEKPNDS